MQAFLQSPLRILSLPLTHVLKHNIFLKNQFQQLISHLFPDHSSQTATEMPEWWNNIWLPILFETHPWQPEDLTAPLEWSWNSSPRTMTRPLERVVWLVWLDRSSESSDWVGNKNEDQVSLCYLPYRPLVHIAICKISKVATIPRMDNFQFIPPLDIWWVLHQNNIFFNSWCVQSVERSQFDRDSLEIAAESPLIDINIFLP